jgi:hypothetical protein
MPFGEQKLDNVITLRLNDDDVKKLDYLVDKYQGEEKKQLSRSDIIRGLIRDRFSKTWKRIVKNLSNS